MDADSVEIGTTSINNNEQGNPLTDNVPTPSTTLSIETPATILHSVISGSASSSSGMVLSSSAASLQHLQSSSKECLPSNINLSAKKRKRHSELQTFVDDFAKIKKEKYEKQLETEAAKKAMYEQQAAYIKLKMEMLQKPT